MTTYLEYSISGTFAVVCLMIGTVCEREADRIMSETSSPLLSPTTAAINFNATTTIPALTNLVKKVETNSSNPDYEDRLSAIKLEVAFSLALLIGIFQVRFI